MAAKLMACDILLTASKVALTSTGPQGDLEAAKVKRDATERKMISLNNSKLSSRKRTVRNKP